MRRFYYAITVYGTVFWCFFQYKLHNVWSSIPCLLPFKYSIPYLYYLFYYTLFLFIISNFLFKLLSGLEIHDFLVFFFYPSMCTMFLFYQDYSNASIFWVLNVLCLLFNCVCIALWRKIINIISYHEISHSLSIV